MDEHVVRVVSEGSSPLELLRAGCAAIWASGLAIYGLKPGVESDDRDDDGGGDDRHDPPVAVLAHDLAISGEADQGNECERETEGEHNLADHERPGGIGAETEQQQGWHDRDDPPGEQRHANAQQTSHNLGTRVRSDRCRGEPRDQQADCEDDPDSGPEILRDCCSGTLDGVSAFDAGKRGGREQQHGDVDAARNDERQYNVEFCCAQQASQPALAVFCCEIACGMTVAPSMLAASSTDCVCGESRHEPSEHLANVESAHKQAADESSSDDEQHRHDDGSKRRCEQWHSEQDVERERAADDLSEVGCGRGDFCLCPEQPAGSGAQAFAEQLGQAFARDEPEFCGEVLHDDRHGVCRDEHPQEHVAVLCAGGEIRGDIARVNVCDGRDEGRAEEFEEPTLGGLIGCVGHSPLSLIRVARDTRLEAWKMRSKRQPGCLTGSNSSPRNRLTSAHRASSSFTTNCSLNSSAVTTKEPDAVSRELSWGGESERLDRALSGLGLARSRSHAAELIAAGGVRVDGVTALKPGVRVRQGALLAVSQADHYVSRGAHKLVAALDEFGIAPGGRLALDLGASTGGFTQVLIERGAREVLAVDVGHGQLVESLRTDPRVRVVEGCNARELDAEMLAELTGVSERPSLIVADLSFISLTLVLPAMVRCAAADAEFVLLIKPQFEVGRVRDGVVTDPELWADAIRTVLRAATERGLTVRGLAQSPIAGGAGNREFLVYITSAASGNPQEWEDRVRELCAVTGQRSTPTPPQPAPSTPYEGSSA
ncbi:hypothetical protein FQR65_LT20487 [Abscondita terminalis]|nr:hypothetical protein FQR65_LT20487 [Abscondita terminalis]